MSNSAAVFEQFCHWLDSADGEDQASRIATIFATISAWHDKHWLGPAPAHPESLGRWLLENSWRAFESLHFDVLQAEAEHQVMIDIAAVAQVLPFVLLHTEPGNWPCWEQDAPTFFVRCPPKQFPLLEQLRRLPIFAQVIGAASHIESPSRTSRQLKDAFSRNWQWPLTIDIYDNEEGRGLFDNYSGTESLFRLRLHTARAPAAILLIAGDVDLARKVIDQIDSGNYAYILATAAPRSVEQLSRLKSAAGVVGAAALALNVPLASFAMGDSLAALIGQLAAGISFDIALHRSVPQGSPVLFANRALLARGSLQEQLNNLAQSLESAPSKSWTLARRGQDVSFVDGIYSNEQLRKRLLSLVDENRPPESMIEVINAFDAADLSQLFRVAAQRAMESDAGAASARSLPAYDIALPDSVGVGVPRSMPVVAQLPVSSFESSRVQAQLVQGGRYLASIPRREGCVVDVWIGDPVDASGAQSTDLFPALPEQTPDIVPLTCIFLPLVGCDARGRGQAQRQQVAYSKSRFTSTPCKFDVRPAWDAFEFGARVLVMYRNKVVQSMMFSASVDAGENAEGARPPVLLAENIVSKNIGAMSRGRDFDFTFVLNHNAAQQTGITTISPKGVNFQEPKDGFRLALGEITTQLGAINMVGAGDQDAVMDQLEISLRALARVGNVLREEIVEGQPDLVAMTSARSFDPVNPVRLQIVEAKVGAFIPLELFYDYLAPDADAKLCAKFVAPGFPVSTCTGCQDRGETHIVCPVGFWGISKVIERRPKAAGLIEDWAQFCISEPSHEKGKLPRLDQIAYGISQKVTSDDQTAIAALISATDAQANRATCWKSWKTIILENAPTMLVVAGHTQLQNSIAELEIEGALLSMSQIEQTYVVRPKGDPPVVLLLGCEMHVTAASISAISGRFKSKGAAVVVATLSKIRGNQVPACIAHITRAFHDASAASTKDKARGHSTVGFALLRAKQTLLANGNSIAMSLTAVGDAEWRL